MKNPRYKNTPRVLTRFPRVILQAFLVLTLCLVAAPAMADPGAAIAVGFAGTVLPAATMATMAVRDLLDKRSKNLQEMNFLDGREENTEEDEQRFDQLADEVEAIDEAVEKKKQRTETRRNRLAGIGAAPSAPEGRMRGPDPSLERELRDDPVINPPRQYSLLRAIRLRAQGLPLDGLEAEISQEIAHRSGNEPQGFFVPHALSVERRDLDVAAGATSGAEQIVTSMTMIDLLRNRARVVQLGATLMTDMVGQFNLPKQTGTTTAQWVAEGAASAETNQTIGQVAFAPSTLSVWSDYTRKFVMQTGIDAEAFVRRDLMTVAALEIDRTVINGSGTGEEPEGILQNSSIPTVGISDPDGGAPTRGSMIDLETEVNQDNADGNSMAYLTNSKVKGKLKQTATDAGSGLFVWGEGQGGRDFLNGYTAAVSNQVPSDLTKGAGTNLSAVIFGDWAQACIAFWSGMDMIVDPFTASTTGNTRIALLQDADVQFKHTEAFAKIVDADTT